MYFQAIEQMPFGDTGLDYERTVPLRFDADSLKTVLQSYTPDLYIPPKNRKPRWGGLSINNPLECTVEGTLQVFDPSCPRKRVTYFVSKEHNTEREFLFSLKLTPESKQLLDDLSQGITPLLLKVLQAGSKLEIKTCVRNGYLNRVCAFRSLQVDTAPQDFMDTPTTISILELAKSKTPVDGRYARLTGTFSFLTCNNERQHTLRFQATSLQLFLNPQTAASYLRKKKVSS
jgi:hypothetical protein